MFPDILIEEGELCIRDLLSGGLNRRPRQPVPGNSQSQATMVSMMLLWFRRKRRLASIEAVVASVAPPDEFVGSMETAKPRCINRAGWHIVCFVDEDARELSLAFEENSQSCEQIIVR